LLSIFGMGAWHVVVERLSEPALTDVAGRAGAGALNALPTIAGRSRIDALRHSLRSQKQRDSTDGCVSAWNKGSDSLLMQFGVCVAL
jgi:hypothetical protein